MKIKEQLGRDNRDWEDYSKSSLISIRLLKYHFYNGVTQGLYDEILSRVKLYNLLTNVAGICDSIEGDI